MANQPKNKKTNLNTSYLPFNPYGEIYTYANNLRCSFRKRKPKELINSQRKDLIYMRGRVLTEQEAFGKKVTHIPKDFLIMLQMIENMVIENDYQEEIEPSSQEISQKYKNQRANPHSIQNITQIVYESSKGIWLKDDRKMNKMLNKFDNECRHYFEDEMYYSQTYKDLFLIIIEKLFFLILVEAQSTFSIKLSIRLFLYLAETLKKYIEKMEIDLYSDSKAIGYKKKIVLPDGSIRREEPFYYLPTPELYVIYTGKENVPDEIDFADLYESLMKAENSVLITDWWLSPEVYLKRPVNQNTFEQLKNFTLVKSPLSNVNLNEEYNEEAILAKLPEMLSKEEPEQFLKQTEIFNLKKRFEAGATQILEDAKRRREGFSVSNMPYWFYFLLAFFGYDDVFRWLKNIYMLIFVAVIGLTSFLLIKFDKMHYVKDGYYEVEERVNRFQKKVSHFIRSKLGRF